MAARALSLMFVSIHAPLARSNRNTPLKNVRFVFQYMLLLRGATILTELNFPADSVSIHAPLARSNALGKTNPVFVLRFNTCSSCEEQRRSLRAW